MSIKINSKDFVKTCIHSLARLIPQVKVRYEYCSMTNAHFVEITSKEIYHINQQYIVWESTVYDIFIKLFPFENICFFTKDALVGIDKVDFELCGKDYVEESNKK